MVPQNGIITSIGTITPYHASNHHYYASMASTIDTKSSLTSKPENLTGIHAQSSLETDHLSRRTKTGFLITQDRLLTRGTGA